VLVMVDSIVMCEGRVSSWERMKFASNSNVRERESRVCGQREVCVGLESDLLPICSNCTPFCLVVQFVPGDLSIFTTHPKLSKDF